MSEANLMIEQKLNEIQAAQKAMDAKFDRLIIGTHGNDGVIPRLSRIEGRQNTLGSCFAVLCMCGTVFAGLLGFSNANR